MPIYEYVCNACDHRADILHGINDPGPNFCPSCGREGTMRKQFAPPAIHYKGSGWAKKDRGSSSSSRASGGSKPSGDSASDGGSKDGGSKDGGSGATSGSAGSSGSSGGSSSSEG
jgi:putative FmdB family regulatory protein